MAILPSAHHGLRDRLIVVARPAAQAQGLHDLLARAGARVLVFPGITIVPLAPSPATRACLAALPQAAWAVFVSANAVEHGLATVARAGGWPPGLRCAAVGAATARALEQAGLGPVLRPDGREDSEGLLAAPGWGNLAGRQVVIFRGEGGREVLAQGLRRAGAEVCHAEVYRRLPPALDPAPLRAALLAGEVAAICAMSGETVHNLFAACGPATLAALRATRWLVPHPRVAAAVRALGAEHVLEAAGSGDAALMAALSESPW